MTRLIDADALKEFIENRYDITWESDTYEGGIKDACTDMLEFINEQPTVTINRNPAQYPSKMKRDLGYREFLAEVRDDNDVILQEEIIRCCECKYFRKYPGSNNQGDCMAAEWSVYEFDYCNHGERKEDEKDD